MTSYTHKQMKDNLKENQTLYRGQGRWSILTGTLDKYGHLTKGSYFTDGGEIDD